MESNKKITVVCRSTPDHPETGFGDVLYITDGLENKRYTCSACPNPPEGKWAWLAPCVTFYECIKHYRYGKTLLLHKSMPLPSRTVSPFHKEKIISEVFIHEANVGGNNPLWRGSRGCITLKRGTYDKFINNFKIGDRGFFELTDRIEDSIIFKQRGALMKRILNFLNGKKTVLGLLILVALNILRQQGIEVPGMGYAEDNSDLLRIILETMGYSLSSTGLLHKLIKAARNR